MTIEPTEVIPGVLHWSAYYEKISSDVSSYYVPGPGVVIDPILPADGSNGLPGDVKQIILATGHHERSAAQLAASSGAKIWGGPRVADELAGRLEVQQIEDGTEFADGMTMHHIGGVADHESVIHIAIGDGALVIADALLVDDRTISFVPDEWLGDDPAATKAAIKQRFSELLVLDFDNLLSTHGGHVIGGGKELLQEFVD